MLDSTKFYSIIEGWDASEYYDNVDLLTQDIPIRIKHCKVYLLKNQSLEDSVYVKYDNDTTALVNGRYIFTKRGDIEKFLTEKKKLAEDHLKLIEYLLKNREKIENFYSSVVIE